MKRSAYIHRYKVFFILLLLTILTALLISISFHIWPHGSREVYHHPDVLKRLKSTILQDSSEIVISSTAITRTDSTCTFYSCFNVYPCNDNDDSYRIKVYVYPLSQYTYSEGQRLLPEMSKEFLELLNTVVHSDFYTSNPKEACILLPPIDVLNQNNVPINETARILASLNRWSNGENHLLFNMLPGSAPDYNTTLDVPHGKALLAGGAFSAWTYRRTYDVAIPIFNPLVAYTTLPYKSYLENRQWLVLSSQLGLHSEYLNDLDLQADQHRDLLVLRDCVPGTYNYTHRCHGSSLYAYPQVLQDATFCLVIRTSRLGQSTLSDALQAGCIPIVVADNFVMPFSEVLDWKRASIVLREEDLPRLMDIVKRISVGRIHKMRQQVNFYHKKYFSTVRDITLTTLQIINDRVFPYAARQYNEWNSPPEQKLVQSPLFLPLIPPKSAGFTAVILTYDRLESLFHVIQQVVKAPSLAKVLVVWNNQNKAPPQAQHWPKINKPLKVVQTRYNKLSNRFFPYDEIETEAILAIDDDIVMLTADELEFGYEVWREFSDRLVGFPSRLHLWDNKTQGWRYESEWTNDISLVLTGAAFYHKHYSFMYTNSMPGHIKEWVDKHVNCEDIAMNFLIANVTGKAPIKVTPRKKFKCPECVNVDMLSADASHMVERSECINRFVSIYGNMPLKTVQFRADPVLYKDNFPAKLKQYNDIGSL